jgi:hypothetical protein
VVLPEEWRAEELAFILELAYCANVGFDNDEGRGSHVIMRALAQPKDRNAVSWPRLDGEWFELELQFLGVRDLRIEQFGPGALQLNGFLIEDYSGRGWDGINFKVEDYEDNRLSLYCNRVIVKSRMPLLCRPTYLPLTA